MSIFSLVVRGDLRGVEEELGRNPGVLEQRDGYGDSPLGAAAYYGHTKVVEVLVGAGAQLEAQSNAGLTPIIRAAARGHHQVVEVLLDRGADIEACYEGILTHPSFILTFRSKSAPFLW